MGVPSSTCSPALTRNSVSSASDTATETRGMRMTKSAMRTRGRERSLRCLDDPCCRWIQLRLQRRRCRCRNESCGHPLDRRGELTEAFRLQSGDDLCTGACELDGVVYDDRSSGPTHRLDDGFDVQRHQRT